MKQDRDGLRLALTEHFRAASAWTAEFQSGGRFHHALPIGVDITVAGGIWLVAQVAALLKDRESDNVARVRLNASVIDMRRQIDALTAEQTRLRAALEHIANIRKCRGVRGGGLADLHEYACPYCAAKAALQPPTPREEPTS